MTALLVTPELLASRRGAGPLRIPIEAMARYLTAEVERHPGQTVSEVCRRLRIPEMTVRSGVTRAKVRGWMVDSDERRKAEHVGVQGNRARELHVTVAGQQVAGEYWEALNQAE